MILEKVISGGQTGVDQAAWRAAKKAGILTGGWMPLGWNTEEGPRSDFAELYGAQEHASATYPPRTYANVHDSDATLWIGMGDSLGFGCTAKACERMDKRLYSCFSHRSHPINVVDWINGYEIKILNVAGNRESKSPGIGQSAEEFLDEVFRMLKEGF